MFHKGEHEKQFAYVAGTACDKRNFILGFAVTSGNVHDSVMFDDVTFYSLGYTKPLTPSISRGVSGFGLQSYEVAFKNATS